MRELSPHSSTGDVLVCPRGLTPSQASTLLPCSLPNRLLSWNRFHDSELKDTLPKGSLQYISISFHVKKKIGVDLLGVHEINLNDNLITGYYHMANTASFIHRRSAVDVAMVVSLRKHQVPSVSLPFFTLVLL